VPPKIGEISQVVSMAAGTSAQLECPAQGYPPPKITWFREVGSRTEEFPSPNHHVLTLSLLEPRDAGRYSCVARNLVGEDKREILLRVITPLNVIIRPLQQVHRK